MANYVDDFEADPIASGLPTGWTDRWNIPSPGYSIYDDTAGGRSLRNQPSGAGRYFASFDAVNADPDRANCEALAIIRADARTASVTHEGVVLRGAGTGQTNEVGYAFGFFGRELRIGRYNLGFTQLAITTGFNAADSSRYRLRARANGSTLQAKAWLDGNAEPGSWTLTVTDTALTAAGWCGFFTFSAPQMDCAAIAVATNGDTATFSAGPTIYRPSSDLSVAGWTFSGAASVAAAIGETAASDAEFATSPNLAGPATVAISPSLPAGTWAVKLRPRRNLAGVGQVRVRLLNSSNVDVGGSDWITPTTSFSLFEVGFTTTGLADRLRIEVQP